MTLALAAAFPALGRLEPRDRELLEQGVARAALPAGAVAFEPGAACEHFLLLLAGSVRVELLSESGREIVLYRVEPGETCVLTTACLLARERYGARAVAETEAVAALVPRALFERLLASSAAFRDFVFAAQASRLTTLLALVEEVAFGRLDARLARRLLELAGADGAVLLTHQALAAELGTAREVVSRLLKDLERRGWIRLERGGLALLDRAALAAFAAAAAR
ncbi:MAG: Crp/Fnr family transcriptional regulator [Proteobacteria bacterium]|nr:Crp/Fnr family transcriptional regulator [Pseudomonadota bacterium]